MSRAERDYGLPPLTFAEAARLLGITTTDFREWLDSRVRTTTQQRSNWKAKGAEAGLPVDVIPAVYLQLYLAMRLGHVIPVKPASPKPVRARTKGQGAPVRLRRRG